MFFFHAAEAIPFSSQQLHAIHLSHAYLHLGSGAMLQALLVFYLSKMSYRQIYDNHVMLFQSHWVCSVLLCYAD